MFFQQNCRPSNLDSLQNKCKIYSQVGAGHWSIYSILCSTHNGLGMEAVRAQARGKTVGAYAVKTVRVYEGRKQLNFMLLKKTVAAYALDKHKSLSFRK